MRLAPRALPILVVFALGSSCDCSERGSSPYHGLDSTDLLPSAREPAIPELQTFDAEADGVVDRYGVSFPTEITPDGHRRIRTIAFDRLPDGSYAGLVRLQLSPGPLCTTSLEHLERIPKAFAANVSELAFSVPPTVVEPDPLVSWIAPPGAELDLQIERTEPLPSESVAETASETLVGYALSGCTELESEDDRSRCLAELAYRFPESPSVQAFASSCDPRSTPCATVLGTLSRDWPVSCAELAPAEQLACYTYLFDAHIDLVCAKLDASMPEAIASCLESYWQQIPDRNVRDLVCFDTGMQGAVHDGLDWSGFVASCSELADPSRCDSVVDAELRERCIGAYARLRMDLAVCDRLTTDVEAEYGRYG